MWWYSVVASIPFLLIVLMLLRHINLERTANVSERAMLISQLMNRVDPSRRQGDESFIPLDDPRLEKILRQSRSTVGEVEGQDTQP
jgi:hypothetical protein